MAVASLELSYTYCLDQVKEACDLIEKGEASNAAFILCSVRDDAKLIQKQSKTYYKGLQRLETVQQKRMEHLTEKINDLYNEEERYSKQESELGIQKQVYIQARESEEASKMAAERRYRDAEREKEKHLKEQRERDEKGKKFWWVPGYNLYLVFEDLIEDNRQKARDASREMENHQRKIRDSEREIDKLSDKEAKARNDIEACIKKQSDAKHERNNLHDKLGATKEMIVLVLKAAEFWDDIASLCDSASMKSENLASVMRSAASKMENTVKILRSSGTQTLVGSFKDSWQEIEEMIRTNDLVIAEEDCPAECILGLQGFLEFGQRGMVTISVDSRTLTLNSIAILMAFVAFFGCFSVIQGTYLTIHSIAVGLAIFIAKIVGDCKSWRTVSQCRWCSLCLQTWLFGKAKTKTSINDVMSICAECCTKKRAKKMRDIYYYSKWVALDEVCGNYMQQIKDTRGDLYKYLEENPTIEQSRRNVRDLAITFMKDLQKAQNDLEKKDLQTAQEIKELKE